MTSRWTRFWKVAAGVVILLLVVTALGLSQTLEVFFRLAFGWIRFLGDARPRVRIDAGKTSLVIALLGAFVVGAHFVLTRLYRARQSAIAGDSPPSPPGDRDGWRWKWTGVITALLVLGYLAGVTIAGFSHHVAWEFRERNAHPRRQLWALHQATEKHKDKLGLLPSGATATPVGRLLHGWQTQLLPYFDRQALYKKINLQLPWNDPSNREPFSLEVAEFGGNGAAYGSRAHEGYAPTAYAANSRLLSGTKVVQPTDIVDGTSNTILAGEIVGQLPAWGRPNNSRDPAAGLGGGPDQFGSPWDGGVYLLYADGGMHYLSHDTDPYVLRALATPAGQELYP
ncbi:MAG: DUF1559 domain-containing protein [Pirellulales bacterium]|nr:DUF1559 domain-containing protein [Pirellulales bacterium]